MKNPFFFEFQEYLYKSYFPLLLDLPPLGEIAGSSVTDTIGRNYDNVSPSSSSAPYQEALLSPELMTPSPVPRTPSNIRTSTIATSPTRPPQEAEQSFHSSNERFVSGSNASHVDTAQTVGQEIVESQVNLDSSHDDTSNTLDQRTLQISGGRTMGSDESL